MITPDEIREKSKRKYIPFLKSVSADVPFSRLVIRGNKSYNKSSLLEFEKEITSIIGQSKDKKGYGYSITYQRVKTRNFGTQDLPVTFYFETEKDFLKYLGKERQVELFKQDCKKILEEFPSLKEWVEQNPVKIVNHHNEWDSIFRVCHYFKVDPKPDLYIRELPVKVHTKFIERNQGILTELLDVIIEPFVNRFEKSFEKRFNLKYREPLVRFRILDEELSGRFFSGVNDLAIPKTQFENLDLPVKKVVVIENKTTYTALTLPKMEKTIVIFGSGFSVGNLKNVNWLHDMKLIYWGDIDVHGFEILSQFRGYFPKAKSILMGKSTFEEFFEKDLGTPTTCSVDLNLNAEEQGIYDLLKKNNWRLEQEKIPNEYVNKVLSDE